MDDVFYGVVANRRQPEDSMTQGYVLENQVDLNSLKLGFPVVPMIFPSRRCRGRGTIERTIDTSGTERSILTLSTFRGQVSFYNFLFESNYLYCQVVSIFWTPGYLLPASIGGYMRCRKKIISQNGIKAERDIVKFRNFQRQHYSHRVERIRK